MTDRRPGPAFVHVGRSVRVVFGVGVAGEVAAELDRMGARRALVVTTSRGRDAAGDLLESLEGRTGGVFPGARVHVPSEVAEAAVRAARERGADALIALGGGSAIGTAKAAALETGLPIVAIPTTYSGSEMTAVWGVTDENRKRTGREERARPRVVLYDPALTLGLPPGIASASGMNAIAHAVEALYAPDRTPHSDLLAEGAIRELAEALPGVVAEPEGLGGRTAALLGAHLAGCALDLTSMGLQHKLAHVLGGTFGLPHAEVHALLLPYVAAFNEPAADAAMAVAARALGGARAPAALARLGRRLGTDRTLEDLGVGREDLDLAAELAVRARYPNPRPVVKREVRELLDAAWAGAPPV